MYHSGQTSLWDLEPGTWNLEEPTRRGVAEDQNRGTLHRVELALGSETADPPSTDPRRAIFFWGRKLRPTDPPRPDHGRWGGRRDQSPLTTSHPH
eukprot:scaffold61467_cov36-Phaeocystis_antarctica.AAC.1